MTMEDNYDVQELLQEAQNRWLKPPEVYFILRNHKSFQLTEAPCQKPPSGSLFLFNKTVVRYFRKDGHNWRRKKSGRTVGEGHERLKVGNMEALNCYYAHGEENRNFQRRSYWMLDPAYENIVLVHYRDISERRRQDSQLTSYFLLGYSVNSPSISIVGNQGSTEVSSESINRMNHLEGTGEFFGLSVADGSHALQNLQDWPCLSNGDLADTSLSCQDSNKHIDSKDPDCAMCINQDETLLHGFEYRHTYETFISYDTNNFSSLPNSGENTMHEKESSIWEDKQEQYPGSIGGDPHGHNFEALDLPEKLPSVLEGVEPYANLAAAQERCLSHSLKISENDPENWMNCQQIFENGFDLQFSKTNDLNCGRITSSATTSLHQEVENPKVPLCSSVPTEMHRFEIQEISPDWGFSNETTKVIIAGSFLCDYSKCIWTCMFSDIEVPVNIIQNGVLCCVAPQHLPGKVPLCIASGNGEPCSSVREFEYRKPQTDGSKSPEELLLLVSFAEMLVHKEDCSASITDLTRNPWKHMIEGLSLGIETSSSTMEWLVQECLKDKLQQWLSSQGKKTDLSTCSMSKEEQGIIHKVAALGFEWALCPILHSGVSVNFRDLKGWTALHWAARYGKEKMVTALIAAGASAEAVTDPTPQDAVGKTPGSIAEAHGHKGLAGYLSEAALTSHLSSLTLEKTLSSKERADVEAERTVDRLKKEGVGITDDQLALQDSLAAVRNAAQAATRIQAAFRAYSFRKRQLKESTDAICEEFGITPNDIRSISFISNLKHNPYRDPKLNKAAVSIQKNYRGWKGLCEFLYLREKIIKIQAYMRGHLARKRYKVIVWAVGILEKVMLRWRHKRIGLRGFRQLESSEGIDYEDMLKVFRKQKVDLAIEDALSKVLSMVRSPDARNQYHRLLESYCQAKAKLQGNASESASISPDMNLQMENDDWMRMLWDLCDQTLGHDDN